VIQIKPPYGLLSATHEGVLWHMLQEDSPLPPNYLWQVEKVLCNILDIKLSLKAELM